MSYDLNNVHDFKPRDELLHCWRWADRWTSSRCSQLKKCLYFLCCVLASFIARLRCRWYAAYARQMISHFTISLKRRREWQQILAATTSIYLSAHETCKWKFEHKWLQAINLHSKSNYVCVFNRNRNRLNFSHWRNGRKGHDLDEKKK